MNMLMQTYLDTRNVGFLALEKDMRKEFEKHFDTLVDFGNVVTTYFGFYRLLQKVLTTITNIMHIFENVYTVIHNIESVFHCLLVN